LTSFYSYLLFERERLIHVARTIPFRPSRYFKDDADRCHRDCPMLDIVPRYVIEVLCKFCKFIHILFSGLSPPVTSPKGPCAEERDRLKAVPPGGTLVLPDCLPTGYYNYTQCSASSGYCWCAVPETGTKVSGTEVPPTNNGPPTCPSKPSKNVKPSAL